MIRNLIEKILQYCEIRNNHIIPMAEPHDFSAQYPIFHERIRTGKIPSRMYKYMSVDTAIKVLSSGTLLFQKARNFNDPFDCNANVDVSQTDWDGWHKYFSGVVKDESWAAVLASNSFVNPYSTNDKVKDLIRKRIDDLGILCLTPDNDNVNMWAYYANNNCGVCLGFDIDNDCDTFCYPNRVSYSNEFPTFNYITNCHSLLDALLHKDECWKEENEYRIIHNYGLWRFNRNALVEVIFGSRIDRKDEEKIRKLIKKNKYEKVNFFRVVPDTNISYKLFIERVQNYE